MNERIKEITGQVLDELVPETWVALGYDKIKEIQYRTAELIVRECVRHFNEDYKRNFDTLWREDLSKSIKQHFGVEE
jgi:hypothetical protein